METFLWTVLAICGAIYFIIFFIWFITAKHFVFRFFGWIEEEINNLNNKLNI